VSSIILDTHTNQASRLAQINRVMQQQQQPQQLQQPQQGPIIRPPNTPQLPFTQTSAIPSTATTIHPQTQSQQASLQNVVLPNTNQSLQTLTPTTTTSTLNPTLNLNQTQTQAVNIMSKLQKRTTVKTQSTPTLTPYTLTNGAPQLINSNSTTSTPTTTTTTANNLPQMVNMSPNLIPLQSTPGNTLSNLLPSQTPQQIQNRIAINPQTPLLPFSPNNNNNNHNATVPTPLNQAALQQIPLPPNSNSNSNPNQAPLVGTIQQTSQTTPRYIRLALFCITQLPNTRSQVQEIITRKDFPDAQKEEAIRKVIQEHQK